MVSIPPLPDKAWRAFIEGPLYPLPQTPWDNDPAFAMTVAHPGLRDSVSGAVEPALTMTLGLVRALTGVDLLEMIQAQRPAIGLCLGFGMNVLEPYDLWRVLTLDRVHAYEWIGEHIIEAAQTLQALRKDEPDLPSHIRLHHGTAGNLSAIADASVQALYTASMFTWEVPMTPETFEAAVQEILRVLATDGVVISRGSSGVLEERLAHHGRMLLSTPHVSVFQKRGGCLQHPFHC